MTEKFTASMSRKATESSNRNSNLYIHYCVRDLRSLQKLMIRKLNLLKKPWTKRNIFCVWKWNLNLESQKQMERPLFMLEGDDFLLFWCRSKHVSVTNGASLRKQGTVNFLLFGFINLQKLSPVKTFS